MSEEITIATSQKSEVINVTAQLLETVTGIESGLAYFYLPHTTAALIVCEDDDELRDDLVRVAEHWLSDLRPFKHVKKNNPNAEAHITSAFAGVGITMAVVNGKLDLGTYQNVLLLEMDGPKERKIRCQVIAHRSGA